MCHQRIITTASLVVQFADSNNPTDSADESDFLLIFFLKGPVLETSGIYGRKRMSNMSDSETGGPAES